MVKLRYSQQNIALSLFSPALALILLILLLPIFIALFFSFTSYSLGNSSFEWVGFKNYSDIFTRSTYKKMMSATLLYVAIVVPCSVALGLGSALLINSIKFGQNIYKAIYFLPVMAAVLAMAIVWEFALHPTIGIINDSLTAACSNHLWYQFITGAWYGNDVSTSWYGQGCEKGFPLWLGNKQYAIWTICFIGIWQSFGFNMVLYLAGLTAIPRDLYQAAEMDGVKSAWSQFRLITLPMLGPTTVFVVTITIIRSFQVFDTVEALTGGGPVKTTYVMMFAIYEKAIQHNLIGIGSAITIVFLLFVMLLTLIQHTLVDRRAHYQ